jgi:large subunit ribosomal protein L30
MENIKWKDIEGKEIIVRQTGGLISSTERQAANIKGLGLKGIGSSAKLKATPEVIGMLKRAMHLIKIEVI